MKGNPALHLVIDYYAELSKEERMSTVGIARRGIVKFIVLAGVNPSALDDFRSPATARVAKMTELDPILKIMLGIGGNPNASAKWQLGRQFDMDTTSRRCIPRAIGRWNRQWQPPFTS